jgi:WD40 repeat protein
MEVEAEPNIGGLAADEEGKTVIVRWLPHPPEPSHEAEIVRIGSKTHGLMLKGHTGDIIAVAITRDGKRCGTAALDNTARVWDLDNPEKPLVLEHPQGAVAIAFSPDGKIVATTGVHGVIWLWDAKTGEKLGKPLGVEEKDHLHCRLRFYPDGKQLIWSGKDGVIRRWILDDRKCHEVQLAGDLISQIEISPDSEWLAIGREGGRLDIMDLETFKIMFSRPLFYEAVSGLSFSATPDGEELAASSLDGSLRVLFNNWRFAVPDSP